MKPRKIRNELIEKLDRPNKVIHPIFRATSLHVGNECVKCFTDISVGESVRYDSEGNLVHALHRHPEHVYDICDGCFLAKPCECDE